MDCCSDEIIQHVRRDHNGRANALASLATSLTHPRDDYLTIHIRERQVVPPLAPPNEENVSLIFNTDLHGHDTQSIDGKPTTEEEDWREHFIQHLMDRREPQDPVKRTKIRRRATRFTLQGNQLYQRSLDGILLRCLSIDEATTVMNEMHAEVCRWHQSSLKLQYQLKRLGYYWLTMVVDCIDYVKRCRVCQLHSDYDHMPAEPLHTTSYSCPFSK